LSTLIDIKIPDIGDVSEAEVIEIAVSVGDKIDVEDTLVVLETDKASMDVPSPSAGIVKEIVCSLGDKLAKDSLILRLEESQTEAEMAPEVKGVSEPTVNDGESLAVPDPIVDNVAIVEKITVPDIGDNDAVEVIEIIAHPGDVLEKEDTLIVLETEKATMEVPSPLSGKIIGINVVVGDKVSFGDLIGSMEVVTTEANVQKSGESLVVPDPIVQKNSESLVVPDPITRFIHASPAVRRFARELGADLSQLSGTGIKGRIVKEDVQKFIKAQLSGSGAGSSSANSASDGLPKLPEIDFSKFGEIESVPLTKIQKISSTNLHRNWVRIPHVTQNDEADITEMEAFRKSMKAEAAVDGIKLTPLAFMMKAVVASLIAFPRFNASLATDGETLIMKKYFHVGVAVDTPDGLVVPVIRNVDQKSVYELAIELGEVSAKAREKKLGMDGMQGSCFAISSLGGIGGTSFTPIVNWPDVAILGVSKSSMKPIWNGEEFIPRLMLPLSLSYDHRVIDGALAARFITHLSKTLGDIRRLVL